MTTSTELHVIFGTGPVGSWVARFLLEKGKTVRMVNRSGKAHLAPDGVDIVAGDATNFDFARQVSQGAAVVYNALNPAYTEWPRLFPALQNGVLEGAIASGAKLISAENVYMYGPVHGKMTEDLPNAAKTRKGRTRAQMAEQLLEAHRAGKVRVALARGSDYFGPGVLDSSTGERVFYPVLAGGKVTAMGNLDVPHTLTYIEDMARAMVTLGERDEALGQIWHVPNAPTLTTRQFLTMVYEAAGTKPQISAAPNFIIRGMGLFSPLMRELAEMLYEFTDPHIVDHSKYARAFGDHSTPMSEAIRRTLDWYRANPHQESKTA